MEHLQSSGDSPVSFYDNNEFNEAFNSLIKKVGVMDSQSKKVNSSGILNVVLYQDSRYRRMVIWSEKSLEILAKKNIHVLLVESSDLFQQYIEEPNCVIDILLVAPCLRVGQSGFSSKIIIPESEIETCLQKNIPVICFILECWENKDVSDDEKQQYAYSILRMSEAGVYLTGSTILSSEFHNIANDYAKGVV